MFATKKKERNVTSICCLILLFKLENHLVRLQLLLESFQYLQLTLSEVVCSLCWTLTMFSGVFFTFIHVKKIFKFQTLDEE